MKSQIVALRVAGTVFGLVFLAQLLRLVMRADVLVAGRHIPLWPSAIALLITGALCAWLFSLSRRAF